MHPCIGDRTQNWEGRKKSYINTCTHVSVCLLSYLTSSVLAWISWKRSLKGACLPASHYLGASPILQSKCETEQGDRAGNVRTKMRDPASHASSIWCSFLLEPSEKPPVTLLELAAQAARRDGLLPESSCHCPRGRTPPSPLWVPGERWVAPSGEPQGWKQELRGEGWGWGFPEPCPWGAGPSGVDLVPIAMTGARGGQEESCWRAECRGKAEWEAVCSGQWGAVGALVQLCFSSFSLRNEGALFLCVYGGHLSHEGLMSFFRGHRGGQRVLLALLNIGPWLSIQQEFFSIGSGLWTCKDSLQWESPPPHLLPKDWASRRSWSLEVRESSVASRDGTGGN